MEPMATPLDDPLLAWRGRDGLEVVAFPLLPVAAGIGTVAMVVAADPEFPEAGVVWAGTGAGVPTTKTGAGAVAVPVGAAAGVENTTCGTVKVVLSVVVVLEDGMTKPEETPVDSTHGTTYVDATTIVVTATGAVTAGGAAGALVMDAPELPLAGTVAAGGELGLLGHPVMIAGFWGM